MPGLATPGDLRKENVRLHKQAERLQTQLDKKAEQLRILEGLASDLQKELAELKGGKAKAESVARQTEG